LPSFWEIALIIAAAGVIMQIIIFCRR